MGTAEQRRRHDRRCSTGRPTLAQERRLVTEIPGPRSRALTERRTAAVSAGGRRHAARLRRARRRRRRRRRRRQLAHRPRLRHRRGQRRQRRPAGGRGGAGAGRRVHPHLLHGHAVRGLRRRLRGARAAHPGDHAKKSALFNSGSEAVENAVKIARLATGRQAVVVFDHAYHGRTNLTMALTAKNMPYKHRFGPFAPRDLPGADVLPVPRRAGPDRRARPPPGRCAMIETQVGRGQRGRRADRADPGRGRLRRPRGRVPARASPTGAATSGAVFIADEIQTGFCRTGDWFACDAEGVVPDLITTAKGIAGGLPLAGRDRPGRAHGRRPRRRPRRHLRRQPGRLRRGPGHDRDDARSSTSPAAARAIEATMLPRLRALQERTGVIGDVRGRGAMLAVELVRPGHDRARRRADRPDRQGLPRAGRRRPHRRHVRQRAALPAAAGDRAGPARRGARRPRRGLRRRGARRADASAALAHPPGGAVGGQQVEEGHGVEGLRAEDAGALPARRSASSSSATTGLTAVCQTTACAPYSLIDHALSTTWYR